MDLREIEDILKLMDQHHLTEFSLEREQCKLHLVKTQGVAPVAFAVPAPVAAAPAPAPAAAPAPAPSNLPQITSPMVGTFYRAPAPDAQPFVKIGQVVEPDTTVCIIEAMKVINEIKAEMRGRIAEIMVDNAEPVEFGQPLFRVEPL